MQYEYKRDVNWKKDLAIGSKQESKFEIFMKSFGYVVEDVSKVKEYQQIDVDFKVTNTTKGVTNLFEVKQDKTLAKHDYVRRRLIIEDISSVKDRYGNVVNTNGWYRKCKSDYIVIGNNDSKMYMYKLADVREYIGLFAGNKDRVIYYQLGNSMMFGLYQKKFDSWLIDNNKICKVFYLDSNKCRCRKDVI